MADSLTITVDHAELFAAIDANPEAVHRHLVMAAAFTADRIASEARGRIRRRTGRTGQRITVDEAHSGDGYVIYVADPRTHVGFFLEVGTKFMTPKEFLFVSARLEEAAHDRRSREAIQNAINETGLGD